MKQELISQYKATLKMLGNVIDQCPDGLWADASYHDTYWRIAYHSLFYISFYLSKNADEFRPWSKHRPGMQWIAVPVADQHPDAVGIVYSKTELRDYAKEISLSLEHRIDEENFKEPSGFEWLPMNKLELHFYIIRHTQHHIGQLVERLHQNGVKGIGWVGRGC